VAEVGSDIVAPMTPPLQKGKVIPNAVSVLLEGQSFHGWKTVSISKSLESVCNEFSILLDDKFDGLNTAWPLKPDTNIRIGIGTERVFTGRIEVVDPSFDAEGRSFTIAGRSNAGDIVDCSHEGPTEYKNISLAKLAEEMVKPFGLKVFLSVVPKLIEKFAVKPGETVFEAIDRAARLQGFFWIATRGGNIRLTRAARARSFSTLEQDVNVLAAGAVYNSSKRYSKYIVKGQSEGLEDFFGKNASQPEGIARDNGVKRNRPLIIIAESTIDGAKAKTRAEWESSTRLAQMARVRVTTDSWRQADGSLWGLNQLIKVKSSYLGLDQDMLSVGITHNKSNGGGTTTDLVLVDPQAYDPKPVVNEKELDDLFANLGPAGPLSVSGIQSFIGSSTQVPVL